MAGVRPIDSAIKKFYMSVVGTIVATVPFWIWIGLYHGGLNVAFVVSTFFSILMAVVVLEFARRRPAKATLSWGEAMVAAMFAFFFMFFVYGIWPHQWLIWADNEMNWRPDYFLVGPGGILDFLPFTLHYTLLRDLIAVVIYGLGLAAHVALFVIWQNRGDEAKSTDLETTTTYGRPLQKA